MNAEIIPNVESLRSLVRSDAEVDARREESRKRDLAKRIKELRENWCAPERNLRCEKPDISGKWGNLNILLTEKRGIGFLYALYGINGGGKTQIAVEAMRRTTANGQTALYLTATDFFLAVKATYRKESIETEQDVIKRYRKPSLLVIDEIDKRGETEWEQNLLFCLINKRYNDVVDTILIANAAKPELDKSLGKSIVSRLNEAGGMIHCDWPSRR